MINGAAAFGVKIIFGDIEFELTEFFADPMASYDPSMAELPRDIKMALTEPMPPMFISNIELTRCVILLGRESEKYRCSAAGYFRYEVEDDKPIDRRRVIFTMHEYRWS